MKSIAIIMPWFLPMPPVRGGAVETLVDILLRQNEHSGRLQITVFTIDDPAARAVYPEYSHVRFVPIRVSHAAEEAARLLRGGLRRLLHYRLPSGGAYLHSVCRALRGQHYDAVICENLATFAPAIHRTGAGEVFLHMHNIVHPGELTDAARIVSGSSRIVSVSDYIGGWMRENLGARPEQCVTLLNCVDVARFREGRAARARVRALLGLEADNVAFIYTGRICPEKGALELARAFSRMEMPEARLIFVGSKWFGETTSDAYRQEIEAALANVRDRVCFTGFVPYVDMPDYYAAADVAVLPSIWEEPAALTVLEAQAAGLPVISTLSGGIPQNVCPEDALLLERGEGLIDRLIEAMRMLALDEKKREAMGYAALEWSRGRTPEAYYEAFLRVLGEL